MTRYRRASTFLDGPAGAGKTTRGTQYLRELLSSDVSPQSILVLTPQRAYAAPYLDGLEQPLRFQIHTATIGGLARRLTSLFWPLIADKAGFSSNRPPVFLTLETAQFYMSRVVSPLIEQGFFDSDYVTLTLPRLYSQLIDNLNKAAANGFPAGDVGARLEAASIDLNQALLFQDVQRAISAFRTYCLQHNLLDFSLYLELFGRLIRDEPLVRDYLFSRYNHLIADNIEEDIPLTHTLIRAWLPHLDSALLIYDTDAGYRHFLSANPVSAYELKNLCDEQTTVEQIRTAPPPLQGFGTLLARAASGHPLNGFAMPPGDERAFALYADRLHHNMVQRVAQTATDLANTGVPPEDIAIISPYLTDSLRYSLAAALDRVGVSHYVRRPSRSLRDEPVTKVLLTLAALAHPAWNTNPTLEAVALALSHVLLRADLVRARLLASGAYDPDSPGVGLRRFEDLDPAVRDRVTFRVGQAYTGLRRWLVAYSQQGPHPIDHFFSRLFGEVLSQPGYGFQGDLAAGTQVATLIESARKFRQVTEAVLPADESVGKAYRDMVEQGVVSASYLSTWEEVPGTVLLAPAYTFLLRNRPVRHQLWLDAGSPGWYRRLNQPLTNPYILSTTWAPDEKWTDAAEMHYETERLVNLTTGLIRRCKERIHIFVCELSPYGQEQNGRLLDVLNRTTRHLHAQQP